MKKFKDDTLWDWDEFVKYICSIITDNERRLDIYVDESLASYVVDEGNTTEFYPLYHEGERISIDEFINIQNS